MYPDTEFPKPLGSFRYPVPPPDAEPDETPKEFLRANAEWMKYVRGGLKQLLLQATWLTDNPEEWALAQQRAMDVIGNSGLHVPNWRLVVDTPGFMRDWFGQRGVGLNSAFYDYAGVTGTSNTFRFVKETDGSLCGGALSYATFTPIALTGTSSYTIYDCDGVSHLIPMRPGAVDLLSVWPGEMTRIDFVLDGDYYYVRVILRNDFTCEVE